MITRLSLTLVLMMFMTSSILADPPEFALVADIVRQQCLDCHNSQTSDGGLNLERFDSYASTIRDRVTWKRIFDAVESGQMPLRDSGYHLTAEQQESLLAYSTELQSQPDPELQAIDPGKPVIRRLTRLEYNNTVRDLFGLPYDIFMFPERLPIADKRYFIDQTVDGLGQTLHTSLSEYGQKVDVLLPHHGLPGDNRAENGFANRGDALNFSPLLLEKYLELAHAIAHSDRLERDSPVMAALLGRSWQPTRNTDHRPVTNSSTTATVTPRYAANNNIGGDADGSEPSHVVFIDELAQAFQQGIGGTFDIPSAQSNQTVAGKGGLIRVGIGDAILSINPNIDLWLTAFATAQETSGEHLLANKVKGEKIFELTFKIEGDNDDVGVEQLAACVLARKGQTGGVTLTAVTSKDQEISHRAVIDPAKGNIFFAFRAPSGSSIRRLRVDGSQFSGDHILLDDLGFILHGVKGNRELPNNHTSSIEKPASHVRRDQTLAAFIEPTAPFDQRLRAFLTLAYRRSVTDTEAAQISAFVKAEIMQGRSEADAIRLAVQSTLASPEFLFLSEPYLPQLQPVRPLTDYELANRLSYFLWSSMPDEELFRLASQKQLTQPETLSRQVKRMVGERQRSRELSESFAVQWLKLDQLYSAKPDRKQFHEFYSGPQGKSTLHGAMLTEPLLLFETVLVENRSVIDLCDPSFTWLNEQLAELYGLQEPYRQTLQRLGVPTNQGDKPDAKAWYRVDLPDRSRGGVFTMAGPLMLTSLPTRTSPVKRGAWLLETIFNRPPMEPKVAFVLAESVADDKNHNGDFSVRQRFEKHRSDPNCNSCHSRIDPPGFALETFDAIGRLRTHDGSQPVDATGVWNGTPFNGPAQFKAALRDREHEFIRGFVEHLLSYGLGRRIEHFDMPAVNEIVNKSAKDGYRIESLIEGLVLSHPFRQTRNLRSDH